MKDYDFIEYKKIFEFLNFEDRYLKVSLKTVEFINLEYL